MVIRLPQSGEGQLWTESITPDPLAGLAPEARAALEAIQAQDDDLFVSTSLADLAATHHEELERRQSSAEALDPDAGIQAVDGFASGVDMTFRRDVEDRLAAFSALQGPKPSDRALQQVRTEADLIGGSLQIKAVTAEDRLRKQAQLGRAERTAAVLPPLVRQQPDTLDEAMRRLDDLGRAIRPLTGDAAADAFLSEGRARLVDSALGGLSDLAPDMAVSALEGGAFDAHLDPARKRRHLKTAKDCLAARRTDDRILEEQLAGEQGRRRHAQALSFTAGFTDRLAAGEVALNEELVRAEADGIVPPAQAAQLRLRAAEAETARVERDARTNRVAALLDEGGTLDPESDTDREDASLYFDEILKPELDALPPAGRIGFIRDLPNEIGFLPDAAICPLAGAVLTGAAAERLAAAKALVGIVERQPDAGNCLPPGMAPTARLFGDLDRLGIDADTAAHWIDDPDSIRNPIVRDMMFRKGRDDGTLETAFQHKSEPVEPTLMTTEEGTSPASDSSSGEGLTLPDAAVGEPPEVVPDAEGDKAPSPGFSGKETEVALAPVVAAGGAALAGAVDGAAIGALTKTVLGVLAGMGILSLPGDSVQQEVAPGSEGDDADAPGNGGRRGDDDDGPGAGQPEPEPPDNPDGSRPPPTTKPGGRGRRARDSSKGERHGDAEAVNKANNRIEALEKKRDEATSRKEKCRIKRRIRNIKKDAEKARKGDTDHRGRNPLKGGKR